MVLIAATLVVSLSIFLMPLAPDSTSLEERPTAQSIKKSQSKTLISNLPQGVENQENRIHGAPLHETTSFHAGVNNHDNMISGTSSRGNDESGGSTSKVSYHTVFSTGCSTFQDWQSYVLFYHLMASGQEGHVTRIASGCDDKDAKILQELFDKEIASMAPGRFHLHLTPDFSSLRPGKKFKYVSSLDDARNLQRFLVA